MQLLLLSPMAVYKGRRPGPQDGSPAGDYDTIGGLDDVGLFNLVDGSNTFEGSTHWALVTLQISFLSASGQLRH